MKRNFAGTIALATLLSFTPLCGLAQSTPGQDSNFPGPGQPGGKREAMKMVPARVILSATLNAKKSQVGETFETKLYSKVQLDNGTELPSGTTLTGTIEADELQQAGLSRLALRFKSAKLKDGTMVAIKATIVGLEAPETSSAEGPATEIPNDWKDGTLVDDQIDVVTDVDLHSRIAGKNSGVFVSTKKDNVVLRTGSQFLIAVASGDTK